MEPLGLNVSAKKDSVLGVKTIISYNYDLDCKIVFDWAKKSESKYVCCANVHMLVISQESINFRDVLTSADLVTLDGRPVFWLIYLKHRFYYFLGYSALQDSAIMQFCGRDVMEKTIKLASEISIPIGFYGNRREVLDSLISKIKREYPEIIIAYVYSPPYRPLTMQEDTEVVSAINDSGTRILFVSLGCPKQEYWMHGKKEKVRSVMMGVGGAFEVIADSKSRPNKLVQNLGFEWLFRLILEPRRLFFRNFYYSPKFIFILLVRVTFKSIRHLFSKINIKFKTRR